MQKCRNAESRRKLRSFFDLKFAVGFGKRFEIIIPVEWEQLGFDWEIGNV